MRILITGVAGFIGSNLSEYFLINGHNVIGIDNISIGLQSNIDRLKKYPNFQFHKLDITNRVSLNKAFANAEMVIHLAAMGSVPRSINRPYDTNLNNTQGLVNVLYTAKEAGINKVVYASSSSVYGDNSDDIKIEDRIGKPLSPYAVSKRAKEMYAAIFAEIYEMQILGMRFFNVFGPYQNPDGAYAAVIPKFVSSILQNQQPTINGSGDQSRDFTHINNVLYAMELATQKNWKGHEIVNVSNGGTYSVNYLYKSIAKRLNFSKPAIHGPERQGDILNSRADVSKINKLLGYKPVMGFEEGLTETVNWYKENL